MKNLLLFFLSFGMIIQSFAQSKILDSTTCCKKCQNTDAKSSKDSITNNIIHLNFQTKKFGGMAQLEEIKRGEFYQLQITNINMNLYKVVIETKDTTITSDVKFPTFDMASLGGIGDILSKLSEAVMTEKFIPNSTTNEALERIKYEVFFIQKQLDTIQKDQEYLELLILSIQSKILSYSLLIDSDKKYFSDFSKGCSIDSVLYKTNRLRKELFERKRQLQNHQFDYTKFISDEKIKKIIEKNPELQKANTALLESFNSSINLTDTLSKAISVDKVISWLTILINKENNEGDYLSLPQQVNGTKTELKISITPQEKESTLPSYMTTLKFPQTKRMYVGIGMGFYGATFKSNTYSTSATVIDSTRTDYKVVNENDERGEIGLVTLLHFGWRPCKKHNWFALNIVTGPALSFTTTVKPRVALGGGLSFGGNQQMLSINTMYMVGYVDQKSNVYDTNTIYNSKPENVTVNKLAGAFGLSLGYIYKF